MHQQALAAAEEEVVRLRLPTRKLHLKMQLEVKRQTAAQAQKPAGTVAAAMAEQRQKESLPAPQNDCL